jgi:hypothetical protein
MREEQGGDLERFSEESLLLTLEPLEKALDSSLSLLEENGYQGGEKSEKVLGHESSEESAPSRSEKMERETEEEAAWSGLELHSIEEEVAEASRLDASVFEETTQLLTDISESPGEAEVEEKAAAKEEGVPSFSWIEYFRNAVETYYEKPHDLFSIWFEECRKGSEFKDSFHALLTILVHSRFDQENPSIKALENTKRVFRLIIQPNLLLDEIPILEGTPFASGEVWRDLFHRALPKVRQIGNAVLEKDRWNAFDLERLIQVIPHMGHPNSLRALQWINELIGDVVEVDFSDTPITIGEGLYRVASRLGIVDPHFDYYQGRNSMGDIKIQSFAKTAFPQNPVKIEEPMAWMGRGEDQGGHCLPVQPWCEGCLFETFCPRLYVHFNPSEKEMRE